MNQNIENIYDLNSYIDNLKTIEELKNLDELNNKKNEKNFNIKEIIKYTNNIIN
tara:strand:+ start:269 stop:430 length:162 start_codon:yes stop_codon:yes gene_type:complete